MHLEWPKLYGNLAILSAKGLNKIFFCFRLFEEAADKLSMSTLAAFLSELCEASKAQLHRITVKLEEESELSGEHQHLPVNSLHLYRLQNVLMKVAHSGRPLIHLLKIWSVVSSYLVEVKDFKSLYSQSVGFYLTS